MIAADEAEQKRLIDAGEFDKVKSDLVGKADTAENRAKSAEEKVASFLVDMARRGASDRTRLPMSRQDMADYLGLALETVSRVLSRFKDEGLVSFTSSRHFQIVRGAALNRLAET